MQSQTKPSPLAHDMVPLMDTRKWLLEEINFKWLMSGRGCWIDMSRFRNDASYATHFLTLAAQFDSPELRTSAAFLSDKRLLQTYIDRH